MLEGAWGSVRLRKRLIFASACSNSPAGPECGGCVCTGACAGDEDDSDCAIGASGCARPPLDVVVLLEAAFGEMALPPPEPDADVGDTRFI